MAARRTAVPAPEATGGTSVLDALAAAPTTAPIVDVALDLIDAHPANPRRDLGDLAELADSIRAHGIRQNLLLVPHPDTPGRYRAVIGHRRSAAAALAGLQVVPAAIDDTLDEATQLELMLLENLQRQDLTAIEEADGYQGLLDLGVSEATIATRTGRSRTTVHKRLRLVALPEKARKAVHHGTVTLDDALAIADLPEQEQAAMAKKLGTANFASALATVRQHVQMEKNAAPLLAILRAENATELPRDQYTPASDQGLVSVTEINAMHYPEQAQKAADNLRDQITAGWAFRWAHVWLGVYRPLTLEEAQERAEIDAARTASGVERAEREAQERVARGVREQFASVTAETRRAFVEHLVHERKALTKDQVTHLLEYAAVAVLEEPWAGQYAGGIFRRRPIPTGTDQADRLADWLRADLPDDFKPSYHRGELLPHVTSAAEKLTAPQQLLAAFAAALEPISEDTWRYGGRSLTTARWYVLLEALGYQVSDAERAALVVPDDTEDDEDADEGDVDEAGED